LAGADYECFGKNRVLNKRIKSAGLEATSQRVASLCDCIDKKRGVSYSLLTSLLLWLLFARMHYTPTYSFVKLPLLFLALELKESMCGLYSVLSFFLILLPELAVPLGDVGTSPLLSRDIYASDIPFDGSPVQVLR
jgi:hypothetical protein